MTAACRIYALPVAFRQPAKGGRALGAMPTFGGVVSICGAWGLW